MSTPLPAAVASRLEKAALDNGFDREVARADNWLAFASTQCPLRIWLGVFNNAVYLAAFSQANVARALGDHGTPIAGPLPSGAQAGRCVKDIPELHRLLRRAFQLSRTLPDDLPGHVECRGSEGLVSVCTAGMDFCTGPGAHPIPGTTRVLWCGGDVGDSCAIGGEPTRPCWWSLTCNLASGLCEGTALVGCARAVTLCHPDRPDTCSTCHPPREYPPEDCSWEAP